jgi:hypothetical protein
MCPIVQNIKWSYKCLCDTQKPWLNLDYNLDYNPDFPDYTMAENIEGPLLAHQTTLQTQEGRFQKAIL